MLGLVAAIAAKERVFVGLALGLLLFGMGELINHPRREGIYGAWQITSRTRQVKPLGLIVELIGLVITGRAAWLLLS